jgi:hypothetical protein
MEPKHVDGNRRECAYCRRQFEPSRYRPAQRVCSAKPCQDRRKADSHRARIGQDPVYAETCRDAQRQWREAHPDYQRHYRQSHPESVDENRRRQSQRDERRRIGNLVKNNLAFDLTPSVSKVLLIGPAAADLDKNNLAQSKLLIYRTLEAASSLQAAS